MNDDDHQVVTDFLCILYMNKCTHSCAPHFNFTKFTHEQVYTQCAQRVLYKFTQAFSAGNPCNVYTKRTSF